MLNTINKNYVYEKINKLLDVC